ncbi:MAG TPA: M20/M25/M40 family metallo-hydrolase [Gammaproteobacteria bacterium]|nr:M20/M25/M40 family metallo-hydrolase [Gammaproteobacteria bacterium]HKH20857.1 M20/M25/M40 family metallo-hydrolase [Gammaproteobacteria bacterium]
MPTFARQAKRAGPFHIQVERLYAPGVADAKRGIVIILDALQIIKDLNFDDYGLLTLLFDLDEETGSYGSRDRIRRLAVRYD